MDVNEQPRIEADGWVSLPLPGGVGGVHARVSLRVDGRAVIKELYVHSDVITPATMRAIPIGRIEALVNSGSEEFRTSDPIVRHAGASVAAGIHSSKDTPLSELRDRVPTAATEKNVAPREPLTRPDGSDPDGFYRRVAAAYNEAVLTTSKPAKVLAEEAEVPTTTVHRWIREARQRGFLPIARKGRAG